MTIQLGAIVFNDGMVWTDEHEYTGIVQEMKLTLGGVPKVFSAPVIGPRTITLTSLADQGWQTYATVKAVQLIAQTIDGQFPLIINGKTYTVGFRHYEQPVVQAVPLTPKSSYEDTDYFQLSVKLISYTA